MLSQEKIYQYLYVENWAEILKILHEKGEEIEDDILLKSASKIFEIEFLSKIKGYDISRKDITDNLETLHALHLRNFYKLSDENYKTLILEIVKRKNLNDALFYAKFLPNEEICKNIIQQNRIQKSKKVKISQREDMVLPLNWLETYNRIFELINNQGNTATYFSGPRFIDTVRVFEPYFPDYSQFINQRNLEGKSTSRKIFYYDILLSLSDESRSKTINRILEITKPFEHEKVSQIENILGNKSDNFKIEESGNNKNPSVFISYSWDDETHKEWVLELAKKLCSDGINVILDRFFLKPGANLPHFVENNISKADRIIIIFTKNYKLKADRRTGGVGYEYSIMNVDLYKNQTSNEKIIPILREGSTDESIPTFMQQFIHIDTRNDENFENSYNDLIREIYNEPKIQKPVIGAKPKFDS
jgi:hypothetical protein